MARVVMFGRLQDGAGWRERRIDADSIAAVKAILTAEDPSLGVLLQGPGVFAVLNHELVRGDRPLSLDDELAFVPPVSGG